ncbi:MAG: hypothetical protein P1U89_06050 [Verrucomicrobiales bacterium]|nr:hypothetical protein [Verrucomicrobiales bacterium]
MINVFIFSALALGFSSIVHEAVSEPTFEISNANPSRGKISVLPGGENTVFKVTSPFGIGRGTIKLATGDWPESIAIRLHLQGLEGFSIKTGDDTRIKMSDLSIQAYDKDGNLFGEKYLLEKAGYYEVSVPSSLFPEDCRSIEIHWVNFYR